MTVLADSWYAETLGLHRLEDERLPRSLARLVRSDPFVRGIALWWYGRRHHTLVLAAGGAAFKTVMILERLRPRGRPYIVLLEFFPVSEDAWAQLGRSSRARSWARRALRRYILAPALRSSLAWAHVLSSWEGPRNAATFGVDPGRFVFLPWPLVFADDALPPYSGRGRRVLASGRTLCDWPTVFSAADRQGWDLEVVCSANDRPLVDRLNASGIAKVRHDIPLQEHSDLLRNGAVYLLALEESYVSSGQMRVMDAVRSGTPLVASGVEGLSDYIDDGRNAISFEPGDALAARRAVNRLLDDHDQAERLSRTAFERAGSWTREQYMEAIRALITEESSR